MELQRHGFGTPSAAHPGGTAGAPGGASGFTTPPASGGVVAPAPGQSRAAAAANQRFIGVGSYGFSLARNEVPVVAAIAAAVVAALLVLLIALGLGRRRRPQAPAAGAAGGSSTVAASAASSEDAVQTAPPPAAATNDPIEAEFLAILARTPSSKRALMGLAAHYAERRNLQGFDELAQRIYRLSGGHGPNWTHVASIGRQLDPDNPLYALEAGDADKADEAELSPAAEAPAPAPEAAPVAPPQPDHDHGQAEAATPHAVEVPPPVAPAAGAAAASETPHPAAPAVEPASSRDSVPPPASAIETERPSEGSPETNRLGEVERAEAEEAPGERAPEPEHQARGDEGVAAAEPQGEPTLPPEAIAALDGLDMGLPPRVAPEAESEVHRAHEADIAPEHEAPAEPEVQAAEPAPTAPAAAPAHSTDEPTEHGARNEDTAHAPPAVPAAAPAVTGLGAAPVGRLNLSFNLDLPNAEAGAGSSEHAAEPPPPFTPEQLARIARNKLDLAAEYIELGDLGGARTLIHEVIDSNDAATHDEAHALLATLAPLS